MPHQAEHLQMAEDQIRQTQQDLRLPLAALGTECQWVLGHKQKIESHATWTSTLHDLSLLWWQQWWLYLWLRLGKNKQFIAGKKRAETWLSEDQTIRHKKSADKTVGIYGPLQTQWAHRKQILLMAQKRQQIRALDEHSLTINEEQSAKLQTKTHLPGLPYLLPHLPHIKAIPLVWPDVPP